MGPTRTGRMLVSLAPLAVAVLLVAPGCMPATQRSGPLEIHLLRGEVPSGAHASADQAFELFRCQVEIVNASDSTAPVRYQDGRLLLYEAGNVQVNQAGATGSTAGTVDHDPILTSTPELPPRARVLVQRDFLLRPDTYDLTLVYRLPGHPDFTWRVR